ncbi:Anti-sigma factor ChrR, cupin superfamily [Pseudomonas cuatrocienegasensis]|uniref:Anti-sigma factor ChrR, cupin superfamily n=1 Tax=Pseudomonas cuatrocienegasensis TaxID=543360 RepID=A0ABY1BLH6_9PSED|nr:MULTISPECIES: cupin domain-containing protein [Pseudomonas]OEC33066.1 cupin [Pseudomonas sp. 21C1]SER11801.1 Anti-sigma factor ChrR, cupin superfamily [Pseudomonas cuatrocienegasensis]
MRLHADFSQPVVIRPGDSPWLASPMAGVERCLLDRIGDEVARATSLVRYAPGSRFSEHQHPGGEEYLVLEGVFSDARGDYPAGTYVRNPIGTAHAPFSEDGCTIFVKLYQFALDDDSPVVIDTTRTLWTPGSTPGVEVLPLHQHGHEQVSLLRCAPGSHFTQPGNGRGEEILVLEGNFRDDHGDYPKGTWRRTPQLTEQRSYSACGCLLWIKTGHLALVSLAAR